MNYRHDFHAGNFADLLKHALLLAWLGRLTGGREPLSVLDTHAGAGLYDRSGEAARRSGEAARGIGVLMADVAPPPVFADLIAAVRRLNGGTEAPFYPGSPLLIAGALRPGDAYVGCELRPDDHARLEAALAAAAGPGGRKVRGPSLRALLRDGYDAAGDPALLGPGRRLLLIDPPFEQGGEDRRIAAAVTAARALRPDVAVAVWAPIKDLDGFDRLLVGLEGVGCADGLVVQIRLRPLADPMRLNGCAMVLLGPGAADLANEAAEIAGWIVERLGEPGGRAVVDRLA